MKRYLVLLCSAGLLTLPAWAAAELKMGYIDSELLRKNLPEFKQAQREMDGLREHYEREMGDRQSKLIKMQEDFRKQELLMSEARKAELQAEFEQRMMQLEEFRATKFGPEGELVQKNFELSAPIFEWVNEVLQEIGKEGTYDFIFDVGRNSGIVYAAEGKYDLTEAVLERLDLAREKKRDAGEDQGAAEDTTETPK
jgi:outer membrane protein